jgi:hypothetical protein
MPQKAERPPREGGSPGRRFGFVKRRLRHRKTFRALQIENCRQHRATPAPREVVDAKINVRVLVEVCG